MELLLYAALFYLWQSRAFLSNNAAAIASFGGKRTAWVGPGYRILSPWPGDLAVILEGIPFELGDGRLFTSGPAGRSLAPRVDRSWTLDRASRIERSGAVIRLDGVPLLRASSDEHAESLERRVASAIREWRERPGTLPREIEQGFSLPAFRTAFDAVRRETRCLRWCCQVYVLLVFAAVPLAVWRLGAEASWLLALPVIAVVHLVALGALYAAERRAPAPLRRRVERWVGASLFPPALLRSPVELVSTRLIGFQPATAAAALLDPEAFVRHLRREVGRLEFRHQHAMVAGFDDPARAIWHRCLRDGLLSLCEQRNVDRSRVLTPKRMQPKAESYCPLCLDEFLVRSGCCAGCGADSIAYE